MVAGMVSGHAWQVTLEDDALVLAVHPPRGLGAGKQSERESEKKHTRTPLLPSQPN